jgi:hypothetical protein
MMSGGVIEVGYFSRVGIKGGWINFSYSVAGKNLV